MINELSNSHPPLFWVEIGRKLPRYLQRNVRLHAKLHPNLTQYLVTENTISVLSKGRFKEITGIRSTSELKQFQAIKKSFASPQESFWINTTSRFFYLHAAAWQLGIDNYFHMESDVVLLDLNSVLAQFQDDGDKRLSYPLETESLGCASLFIVRNRSCLEKFLEYILGAWDKPETTDMTLLGAFAKEEVDCVELLPTWIKNRSLEDSVFFDAGTIGKFYLGSDARNFSKPFSRRGVKQNSFALVDDLSALSVGSWRVSTNDKYSGNSYGISVSIGRFQLSNIHIHSKHIPRSPSVLEKVSKSGFEGQQSALWRLGKPDWIVFLERLIGHMLRRVRIKISKHISLR
jgi:hypothetical protein